MNRNVLRVAAVMEAATITGPAKNLIEFCKTARQHSQPGLPLLQLSVVTFVRDAGLDASNGSRNLFLQALDNAGIDSQVVAEKHRFDPSALAGLRRAVTRYAPDLIQTHNVKSHFLTRLSGLNQLFPWIAFHHGYTSTDFKMELYNRLDRWSLPAARRVVTVCKPFAEQMVARGVQPERITILHNSVRIPPGRSLSDVTELRNALRLGPTELVVLSVGRFSKEKGHADLVEAVAGLRRIFERSFKVVLVGDGPERAPVMERIASLGLQEIFFFAGQVSNVDHYYAVATVMALPSHSEGSPNVLLEAMARGVPVVATGVGGVPEILEHERSGLIVPPRNPSALGRALYSLLVDPSRADRLAAAARSRVQDFTPEAYLRSMLDIYLEVMNTQGLEPLR
jgi:glycosyltransferase involved in cell wall biosynthesis